MKGKNNVIINYVLLKQKTLNFSKDTDKKEKRKPQTGRIGLPNT